MRGRAYFWAFLVTAAACGSRTGLGVDEFATLPAGPAAAVDGTIPLDASVDRAPDRELPGIEAGARDVAIKSDCPDADTTFIYVIGNDNMLYAFNPPAGTFKTIGRIACPDTRGEAPFSMAVDRRGTAYVVFSSNARNSAGGRLYRVSTATAACTGTSFVPGQRGFRQFGMGFSTDENGPAETLYIAGSEQQEGDARGLASIALNSFAIRPIGTFVPDVQRAELTGTGDGRLFAFYTREDELGSYVGELDKNTARLIAETRLPTVVQGQGWAFAFWGGDFYLFVGPSANTTRVLRYRPADGSVTEVASLGSLVVGAGVSTCAPE